MKGRNMELEEKYKLALFAVVRNNLVYPKGIRLGKDMTEINIMSVDTVNCILDACDFEALKKDYESTSN